MARRGNVDGMKDISSMNCYLPEMPPWQCNETLLTYPTVPRQAFSFLSWK